MARLAALVLAAVNLCAAGDDEAIRSITAALRAQHFQEALSQAQAAHRASPKEVRILVLEGMALTGLDRDTDALAAFKTALEISPQYIPALEAAAEIAYRQGARDARPLLERLLALRPGEPTAHAMLGALAWKQHDCATAVQHFGQAKTAIAAQPDALREYGACLVKTKQAEQAAAVFEQLLAIVPDDRRARYSLAVALLDATHFQDAIAALAPLTGSGKCRPHRAGAFGQSS